MMKMRRLLACAIFVLCVAGSIAPARGQGGGRAFDPGLSLEETIAWLGKQLTFQTSAASPDGKYVWRRAGKLAKSKGCRLSYTSTSQRDRFDSAAPGQQMREVWALDLSGLDPATVTADVPGQIRFSAADSSPDAIKINVFRDDKPTASGRKRDGYFAVPEKASAEEVVAGLRHAIGLCRPEKQ